MTMITTRSHQPWNEDGPKSRQTEATINNLGSKRPLLNGISASDKVTVQLVKEQLLINVESGKAIVLQSIQRKGILIGFGNRVLARDDLSRYDRNRS